MFLCSFPRSCMASRTRSVKRTGSSSQSSFLLCWRNACLPATASNQTIPLSTQDTNLLGMSSKRLFVTNLQSLPLRRPPHFWKWWNSQLIDKQWYILFPNDFPDPESDFSPSVHHPFDPWNTHRTSTFTNCSPKCDFNLFSLFLCLFSQVNVREGYWGTHCTAQIVGRNESWRDVTGLDPPLSGWPPFPPRPVCLCKGGWEEGGGCGRVNWGYTYTSRIKRLTKSNTLKSDCHQQHRRDNR